MKFWWILIVAVSSCTFSPPGPTEEVDPFNVISEVMKEKNFSTLKRIWGNPKSKRKLDEDFDEYSYAKAETHEALDVVVERTTEKIKSIQYFFNEDVDHYAFLKEKFGKYKWIEKPFGSQSSDVILEEVLVTIPEAGISFDYDKLNPQRKSMGIYFE